MKFDESYFERDDKSLVLFFFLYDRMKQKSRRGQLSMDKLDRKNTITIKINNNDSAYIDERKKKENQSNKQKEEIKPGENEQSVMETAATQEEESFEWILPTATANKVKKDKKVFFDKKTMKPQKTHVQEKKLRNLFFSVIIAVLVGTGFGYVIWQTIIEKVDPVSGVAEMPPPVDKVTNPVPGTDNTSVLPVVTVTVVQAGVFSNLEAAQELQSELQNANMTAAVLPVDQKYYTIISTSASLEDAKAVSVQLRESGMDAYWKEFSLGGNKQVSQTELNTLTASFALYKQLVGDNDVNSLETSLTVLQDDVGENEVINEMVETLSIAVEAFGGNEDGKNAIIQQQLLQYVVLYNQFVQL